MSAQSAHNAAFVDGLVERCRAIDPAGAFAVYALYTSVLAGLSATAGFMIAASVAGEDTASVGGVYAGILPTLSLMMARPGPSKRLVHEMAAVGGSILVLASVGCIVANVPGIAQPLTVLVAFAAFYVRRWPEPLPNAGLLGLIAFLISQILAPLAPAPAIASGILPAVATILIGFWFMPRQRFSNGLVAATQRLRTAVPGLLHANLSESDAMKATVSEMNGLVVRINAAREQADRFNGAEAKRHLDLAHDAAVVARVWENAAESLYRVAHDVESLPAAARDAALAAKGAAATAFLNTSHAAARAGADAALAQVDKAVSAAIADRQPIGSALDGRDTAVFALLNVELTLSHLLDAVGALDRELATWAEAGP